MEPERLMNAWAPTLEQLSDGNPLMLAGRILGLGEAEMAAGVPKWAWFLGGAFLGGAVMLAWGEPVRRVFRRGAA